MQQLRRRQGEHRGRRAAYAQPQLRAVAGAPRAQLPPTCCHRAHGKLLVMPRSVRACSPDRAKRYPGFLFSTDARISLGSFQATHSPVPLAMGSNLKRVSITSNHSLVASCAGLTRASIYFAKSLLKLDGLPGQGPAMTAACGSI